MARHFRTTLLGAGLAASLAAIAFFPDIVPNFAAAASAMVLASLLFVELIAGTAERQPLDRRPVAILFGFDHSRVLAFWARLTARTREAVPRPI